MSLVVPIKTIEALSEIKDPDDYRVEIFRRIGNLENMEVFLNRILIAVYIQYARSKGGGLILPTDHIKEDLWQGRAAMVLRCGPAAFVDNESTSFYGHMVHPGDWVSCRVQKGTPLEINQVPCRLIEDYDIEMRILDPRYITGSAASTDTTGRTYDLPRAG
jgi:hypothetical protein